MPFVIATLFNRVALRSAAYETPFLAAAGLLYGLANESGAMLLSSWNWQGQRPNLTARAPVLSASSLREYVPRGVLAIPTIHLS